mmetsp:Transcript_3916/g.6851  ORF Transcript_3916/g.6851 Transcript_3916/m.6851 type:complete len:873 (-) Transcript_3916:330-2948(-)
MVTSSERLEDLKEDKEQVECESEHDEDLEPVVESNEHIESQLESANEADLFRETYNEKSGNSVIKEPTENQKEFISAEVFANENGEKVKRENVLLTGLKKDKGALLRVDSDASVEDLIFREARRMQPILSSTSLNKYDHESGELKSSLLSRDSFDKLVDVGLSSLDPYGDESLMVRHELNRRAFEANQLSNMQQAHVISGNTAKQYHESTKAHGNSKNNVEHPGYEPAQMHMIWNSMNDLSLQTNSVMMQNVYQYQNQPSDASSGAVGSTGWNANSKPGFQRKSQLSPTSAKEFVPAHLRNAQQQNYAALDDLHNKFHAAGGAGTNMFVEADATGRLRNNSSGVRSNINGSTGNRNHRHGNQVNTMAGYTTVMYSASPYLPQPTTATTITAPSLGTNPQGMETVSGLGFSSVMNGYHSAAPNTSVSAAAAAVPKYTSLAEVSGRIVELARDQHGCRFLQTKLEEGSPYIVSSIFQEAFDSFVDLMTDPFGNYLCQKLFEHCSGEERLAIVQKCGPALARVSANMHGTRAVQRMVECLVTQDQISAVVEALAPSAVFLMKDVNGNHVIQRCLHRMNAANNQFVYDAVTANCFELATHRHGCCVMQRCMDYADHYQRDQIVNEVTQNALSLVQNAFGNYVVQYILDLAEPKYTLKIIYQLQGSLPELSVQKFSSNVIEKCLEQAPQDVRSALISELIANQDVVGRLLFDAYGNYVVQRALCVAQSPQLEVLCDAILPHLPALRSSPYGKRIQTKIMKRMPRLLSPQNTIGVGMMPEFQHHNGASLGTPQYSGGTASMFAFSDGFSGLDPMQYSSSNALFMPMVNGNSGPSSFSNSSSAFVGHHSQMSNTLIGQFSPDMHGVFGTHQQSSPPGTH